MKYLLLIFTLTLLSCGHISKTELERPLEPNVELMAFKSIDKLLENQSQVKKLMTFTNSNFTKRELLITMSKNPQREIMIVITTKGETKLATISSNPKNNQIRLIPDKYLNFLKNYILTDFILVHGPVDFINKELSGFKVAEANNERKIQRNGQPFSNIHYVDKKLIKVDNFANKYQLMIQEI